MKKLLLIIFTLFLSIKLFGSVELINEGWKFQLKDDSAFKELSYDDSQWRVLNIPHDWALENGYHKDGAQGEKGGYAIGGVAWYRKSFELSKQDLKEHIFIDFDGVYMNSEVWINGVYLGKCVYGYIPFSYELTKHLKEGKNLISVRVDNAKEPSARWYHICGIHGNVYLRAKGESYFEKDGTFLRTLDIKKSKANLMLSTEIVSDTQAKITLEFSLSDAQGRVVLTKTKDFDLSKGLQHIYNIPAVLENPQLWSPESPVLYRAKLNIRSENGDLIDTQDFAFGVRSIAWNKNKGFFLNGKQYKLQGVCEHLEGATALNTEKIWRWKIQLLKDMGCNAIRTAHNPFLPEFYDICDEIGMLVLDEAFDGWIEKAKFDYGAVAFEKDWQKDLTAFIRRDRNHPSVFLYSVGNETRGKVSKKLVALCHELDPTRLVTSGSAAHDDMDIDGWNGGSENLPFVTKYKPKNKPYLGTEHPHTWQVRGFYRTQTWYRNGANDPKQKPVKIPNLTEKEIFTYDWCKPEDRNPKQVFNSSYDNATKSITTRHSIEWMRKYDWNSGAFRWTGFDYRGEAGYVHGGYPFRAFMGGALDLAGFKKDLYYLYQSEWTNIDMVHILPHWTHPDIKKGELIPVRVYTTGDEAELFINNRSLGKVKKGKTWDKMNCDWLVPWQEGVVEVIAYRKGKEIARATQKTSLAPSKLDISKDAPLKADENDICLVSIRQVDDNGTLYPYGENRIYVKLFGGAKILSFENGNPVDLENNYDAPSRKSFFGLSRAFVQSTDKKENEGVSMLCAVISYDKQLILSDKVSIDVQEIALRGKIKAKKLEIFYSTDGSEVSQNSNRYTAPFSIKLGTTVKAKVYFKGEAILDLSSGE